MKTYFGRHTHELDVDNGTRQRLWDERVIAIHFPEGRDGTIGPSDNESLDPADYPPNAAQNVRALRELAHDGGYVLAEHHGHDEVLVGRVDAGTPIELIRGRWGNAGGRWIELDHRDSRPAVLKGLRLQNCKIVSREQLAGVWETRPPRGTLRRWPRAGNAIAQLVDGRDVAPDGANHWERAFYAWNELADYAHGRQTVTYVMLGKLIGIHHRAVQFVLEIIQDYCLENRLPPFTILVVNKASGIPGPGFIAWDTDDLAEGFEQVFAFDWKVYGNPFTFAAGGARREDIVTRLVNDPASAEDVYAITRVRGSVQMLFRDALLRAYSAGCAFSGSMIPEGLEAAHLVPWRYASHRERMDVRNGVLLTSWHHRLFDAGLLTIGDDYSIRLAPGIHIGSRFDQQALAELDGSHMRLPADRRLHPDPALIRRRNELLGIDV